MNITRIGIDLAKQVFQLHAVIQPCRAGATRAAQTMYKVDRPVCRAGCTRPTILNNLNQFRIPTQDRIRRQKSKWLTHRLCDQNTIKGILVNIWQTRDRGCVRCCDRQFLEATSADLCDELINIDN